mmetsp:Transcript_28171/g.47382  ORF Transcript_28171/g.47382 Transcript_28171/m.47382 type:complete len:214 (-) Transcript_28171:180-821(-)|eukprot:CAMPEP_0174975190 /NCGR_PEP_ID=MMETSP0004_2-20121128/12296_1 /TAXON_ID=420556 /ORGANISM="Ochromonas sp., Strain CCMP1393" /LENGTH=213 /DNA_ID=CAMNT_0016225995 /DNA_START=25 /DNA_END=666 /DNA_ORIENTATION=+
MLNIFTLLVIAAAVHVQVVCWTHPFIAKKSTLKTNVTGKQTLKLTRATTGISTSTLNTAAVATLLGFLLPANFQCDSVRLTFSGTGPPLTWIQPAAADSTGKMSTKLTARKRYLPRIITGVQLFDDLAKTPSKSTIDTFIADELPGLNRAMNLYGASLRKGEVPDEISRQAELLTEKFVKEVTKLANCKDIPSQVSTAKSALGDYISFAKIEL